MTQKTATRRGKFGRPNGISHNSFLALLRLESRISQKEVAIATHVSQPLVSNIEKGKTPADILYLYRLAELYAVPSFGEFCEKYLQDLIATFRRSLSRQHRRNISQSLRRRGIMSSKNPARPHLRPRAVRLTNGSILIIKPRPL